MTVVLVVLDGFGLNEDPARNALLAAPMWNWHRLLDEYPHARLAASGEAVGLPAGQMGNSEVGHLNLGAGFRVLQDLPRISEAIADGSFFANEVLAGACREALASGGRLHLMGLVGPGGIHAVDEHLVAMVEMAAGSGLPPDRVIFHAFTDGRDTPPRSADRFLPDLVAQFAGRARIGSVSGRFYAMDRDRRWERTARAYEAIVHGRGPRADSVEAAIAAAYAREEGDEFIQPTAIGRAYPMADGDAVIHLNFRADRARQLTRALAVADFDEFDRAAAPRVSVTTLTEYQSPGDLPVRVAFPPLVIDSLAAHLARLGKRQLHVAKTEKYAHVTYFFNGGLEDAFPGEDRILIPSNREVATYDLAPEMSATPITDAVVAALDERGFDFVVVNYANPDMVGHTGIWDAAVRAAEVIDGCLGRLARAALGTGSPMLITADHGNIEEMRDPSGQPQTKHTTSPVPVVLVSEAHRSTKLRDGALSDVAPTLCELLGIPVGPQMKGRSLLER
ncbi:MAG TPA: 2,3-bisphosphoglycerate-independent phosphoglycerate mutase [Candidatus Limnocylindria bacterium]|nr:2,3-bisphosphoglycerate-independent phosphoglycerate mutase [Candidatus Limnocylindria bacterium]